MDARRLIFTSGKGGVGKSTLECAMSGILCADGKKVLSVDCDTGLRCLDIMFGAKNIVYDWGDVISGACDVKKAVVSTKDGDLLAAPLHRDEISRKQFSDMLAPLRAEYDFIFLDCPAGIGSGFELALSAADFAVIISTPDDVCVRSAGIASDKAYEAGVRSRLVINRFRRNEVKNGQMLNIDRTIDAVGSQLIGVIPEDEAFAAAVRSGISPDMNGPACKALIRTIKRLYGHNVPLEL
jgi:septum site-determining protein MinD